MQGAAHLRGADAARDGRARGALTYRTASIALVTLIDWFICISPIAPLIFTGPSSLPSARRPMSRPVFGEKTRDEVAAESPETRNRAADVRLTSESCQGWANAHASGVVHRLVSIGTRLPGRAV